MMYIFLLNMIFVIVSGYGTDFRSCNLFNKVLIIFIFH